MSKLDECIKKLKMLYELPPYDKGYNPCYQDGYFARSIVEEFGIVIVNEAREMLGL